MNNDQRNALFVRLRNEVDQYIGIGPSTSTHPNEAGKPAYVDLARFQELYDRWAESIADNNRGALESTIIDEDDNDSLGAFDDSTLKHQVFDYVPNHMYDKREVPLVDNDISEALALYLIDMNEYQVDQGELMAEDVTLAWAIKVFDEENE